MKNLVSGFKPKCRRILFGFALLLTVAGCQVPDLQPYADATARLREAIQVTGEITVACMKGDRDPFERPPSPGDKEYPAWKLSQLWEIRLAAANALVAYSDALADISAARKQAPSNSQKLGSTMAEIAHSLGGVSAPSQEVVALATKITEIAIKVKAAHDLAKAVECAQPAIEGIAELLIKDLDDLLQIYQSAHRDLRLTTFFDRESEKSKRYVRLSTYRVALREHVQKLRDELQEKKFADSPSQSLTSELEQAEELLNKADMAFLPYQEENLGLMRERERVEALFRQAEAAVTAWLQTHRDLAAAIKANRRPNWRELLRVSQELHPLIEKVREDNRDASRMEIKR